MNVCKVNTEYAKSFLLIWSKCDHNPYLCPKHDLNPYVDDTFLKHFLICKSVIVCVEVYDSDSIISFLHVIVPSLTPSPDLHPVWLILY